jgi:hypothetical protein
MFHLWFCSILSNVSVVHIDVSYTNHYFFTFEIFLGPIAPPVSVITSLVFLQTVISTLHCCGATKIEIKIKTLFKYKIIIFFPQSRNSP